MPRLIDAYLPTIHTDWVEFRAIGPKGRKLQVRLDSEDWQSLTQVGEDQKRWYYRRRFRDLAAGSPHVVELQCDTGTRRLPFRTLQPLGGAKKVTFGVLPDLHIRPHAASGRVPTRTKRLYSMAEQLAMKYVQRIQQQGADLVMFPGDTLDPCDDRTIEVAHKLIESVDIPCRFLIGNHETYGRYNEQDFYRALGLAPNGYESILVNDVALIFLSTPHQGSLTPGGRQFQWLADTLDQHADHRDTLILAHFSLLLHPCVQGWRNDGMQQLWDYQAVLDLMDRHSRIRAYIAGHKNIPSRIVRRGVLHLLCPQLIQAPCGYSLIEAYEDGLRHTVFEIDEQPLAQISRDAYGAEFTQRYGNEAHRNYIYPYGVRVA